LGLAGWDWMGFRNSGLLLYSGEDDTYEEFPQLAPHDFLKKWLYIDSRDEDFEPTMERVAEAMARDDQRFGIRSKLRKDKVRSRAF
jgi:hypothetical protein